MQELWLAGLAGAAVMAYFGGRMAGRATARNEAEGRALEAAQRLSELQAGLERLKADLKSKAEEATVLEELARELGTCHRLEEAGRLLLRVAGRVLPCQSSALFWPDSRGDLTCVCYTGPHGDRLESLPLLGMDETSPLARAGRSQETVRPDRICPDEMEAVAVPVPPAGVLYAGSPVAGAFAPERLHLLRMVCNQAAPSLLTTAQSFQQQGERHRNLEEQHRQLEDWSSGLGQLLDGLPALVAAPDPEAMWQRAGDLALRLSGADSLQIWLEGKLCWARPEAAEWSPDHTELMKALTSGAPLIFDELAGTRFGELKRAWNACLAVGLPYRGGLAGCLLLGGSRPGCFDRTDAQLMGILALQSGVALEKTLLHLEMVEAYRRLQESEAQLIQSSKMAAVGQLAAGVAHEINNPLGSILLAVDAVYEMEARSDVGKRLLTRAREATVRAQQIVSKLLLYSRETRSERSPRDLNQVVLDTLDLIGKQLKLDGVAVRTELSQRELFVLCNANELQQVLTNLMLNARDALKGRPGAQIVLSTARVQSRAVVEVQDNGPGVPEEVRDRIFDPFFTTKPVGKGTGLGLSVCQQIVAAHGGVLSLRCAPGQTTFVADFPAVGAG
ncbi:MAG: HAMP domain-containing sensor histidine kinase [Candidatus Eremiobacterota bacterium]